ncbi:MAG: sugar-binding transcriptional regulator [Liquorilactobacillus nagelii]|uniref:sugar-binding transcriptional regulator n=1 Tax=Liquorilactobacillus nagelii TaxID=82688 RepID=UPI0039E9F87A
MIEGNEHQIKLAVKISQLHYVDKMSQTEISRKLSLSRPTVSRALQYAISSGIVQINIRDPFDNLSEIARSLREKYQLKKVIIAKQESNLSFLDQVGKAAASYLVDIIQDGDTIGLSWGKTLYAVAKYLKPTNLNQIHTVYLKGTVANSSHNNYSNFITTRFNEAFHTQTEILPVPVIFDNAATHDLVLKDRFIKNVVQKAYDSNIALFTVGTTRPTAMLFNLGYLSSKQINYLEKNSVGDIISQFIDYEGNIVDRDLISRTMALSIDNLRVKEKSILIASGLEKLVPIHAALTGGYANVLIIDNQVAKELIDL